MKTKHTPGPWRVVGDGRRIAVEAPRSEVAIWHWPTAVDKADAHLIAAAPELLETLECMTKRNPSIADFQAARAAIAKAKGETP